MAGPGIKVSGLKELRGELSKLEDATSKAQVKKAFMDAADYVAVRARVRVPSRSGRAAKSITAFAQANRAGVKGGGTVPYYGWLDFGSRTPVLGNPRSRGPWSGSGKGPDKGRFIYPTVEAEAGHVIEMVANGLQLLIKDAGLG